MLAVEPHAHDRDRGCRTAFHLDSIIIPLHVFQCTVSIGQEPPVCRNQRRMERQEQFRFLLGRKTPRCASCSVHESRTGMVLHRDVHLSRCKRSDVRCAEDPDCLARHWSANLNSDHGFRL